MVSITILLYARLSVPTFVPSKLKVIARAGGVHDEPRPAPDKWVLRNEKFEGVVHPRDVFLWYPQGMKTSSTVASTIIARAYERAGLAELSVHGDLLAGAPGAHAGVAHEPYSDETLEQLQAAVQNPVLLVLSIREGSDWVESIAYRRDHQRAPDFSPTCKETGYGRSTCESYKIYVPEDDKSVGRAWWVIRHENVIKDTHMHVLCSLGWAWSAQLRLSQGS